MDDLAPVKASFEDQAVIFMRKHNWILSWLYLGTFGSFIGFAAGFPLVAETEFAGVDATAYAFVGPLLGALARPAGGWLADRIGGARDSARVLRRDGARHRRACCVAAGGAGRSAIARSSRCSRCCSSRAAPATAPCSR